MERDREDRKGAGGRTESVEREKTGGKLDFRLLPTASGGFYGWRWGRSGIGTDTYLPTKGIVWF